MHAILNRPNRMRQIPAAISLLIAFANAAPANIFQWEYINPAAPSLGKQQSTTLAPDGAGVDALPGNNYDRLDLTMANLNGADLHHASLRSTKLQYASMIGANLFEADLSSINTCCGDLFYPTDLTSADLSHANLTNAKFYDAKLTDTDFTDADIRGTSFGTLTLAQLYSTFSYQARDLSGAVFRGTNLDGGNFAGQNLTNVSFIGTALTGANFRDANLSSANFQRATLTSANFAGQNISNADFSEATLTDANFTSAQIRGASFGITYYRCIPGVCDYFAGSGITPAQLYSTASYQASDLSGINLELNELAGVNFAGQNLANANFALANLTGANFREANLANAGFAGHVCQLGCGRSPDANLADADLTAADARGANIFAAGAITTNLVWPNGHIDGLDLNADGLLIVRDYDGNPTPIPITVDQHLAMGPGGSLRMVFEADAWESTISFAPGIPVTLGGMLELTFAADVNLASQVGSTFDLFDWTGVNPTGTFAVSSPYAWDLSNLYITGEVTLTAVPEPTRFAFAAAVAFSLSFYRKRKTP